MELRGGCFLPVQISEEVFGLKLRNAVRSDIQSLIELMDQLGYKTSSEALYRNLEYYGPSVFVVEAKDGVIGCLAYHILPQFHSEELFMRIVSLVVDQFHRGKGVGALLLQAAEKIAKEKGCTVIELTSASHRISSGAHDFYKKQGYLSDGKKIYFRKEIDL
jgi:GNAT superfamily N-acetyltransferase